MAAMDNDDFEEDVEFGLGGVEDAPPKDDKQAASPGKEGREGGDYHSDGADVFEDENEEDDAVDLYGDVEVGYNSGPGTDADIIPDRSPDADEVARGEDPSNSHTGLDEPRGETSTDDGGTRPAGGKSTLDDDSKKTSLRGHRDEGGDGVARDRPDSHGPDETWRDETSQQKRPSSPPAPPPQKDQQQRAVTEKANGPQPSDRHGQTSLFVGELQWWTTDAELEKALSEFGKVKNLRFFEERVNAKSKGYAQVDFSTPAEARACKEQMHGRVFNGRPCVVTYVSASTMNQFAARAAGAHPGGDLHRPGDRVEGRGDYPRDGARPSSFYPRGGGVGPRDPMHHRGGGAQGGPRDGPPRDGYKDFDRGGDFRGRGGRGGRGGMRGGRGGPPMAGGRGGWGRPGHPPSGGMGAGTDAMAGGAGPAHPPYDSWGAAGGGGGGAAGWGMAPIGAGQGAAGVWNAGMPATGYGPVGIPAPPYVTPPMPGPPPIPHMSGGGLYGARPGGGVGAMEAMDMDRMYGAGAGGGAGGGWDAHDADWGGDMGGDGYRGGDMLDEYYGGDMDMIPPPPPPRSMGGGAVGTAFAGRANEGPTAPASRRISPAYGVAPAGHLAGGGTVRGAGISAGAQGGTRKGTGSGGSGLTGLTGQTGLTVVPAGAGTGPIGPPRRSQGTRGAREEVMRLGGCDAARYKVEKDKGCLAQLTMGVSAGVTASWGQGGPQVAVGTSEHAASFFSSVP
eukprot:jgi/Mesvir1/17500/Mv08766-RA.1